MWQEKEFVFVTETCLSATQKLFLLVWKATIDIQ